MTEYGAHTRCGRARGPIWRHKWASPPGEVGLGTHEDHLEWPGDLRRGDSGRYPASRLPLHQEEIPHR